MTPYGLALDELARAEAVHARLRTPATLAAVCKARKVASDLFKGRQPAVDGEVRVAGSTIGNRS
jgi:hypothetical protein